MADDLGGGIDPDGLRGEVTATVDPETVNLQITATDPDPVAARDIAQAYAEQMKSLVANLEPPDGKKTQVVKASIIDNAQATDTPVSPRLCATSGWPSSSGCCCWASASRCSANCSTPRSPRPRTSPG